MTIADNIARANALRDDMGASLARKRHAMRERAAVNQAAEDMNKGKLTSGAFRVRFAAHFNDPAHETVCACDGNGGCLFRSVRASA